MEFAGKRVLVTGGSRGIGRAVAEQFARYRASVAINYNTNLKAAEETLAMLPGGPHAVIQADIRKPGSVQRLIDTTVEQLGGLDIVVNNAGIFLMHRLDEVDYEE
ncbi:MAG: SDR family NAD(P)-dependent oxidoreductase, partial [bacterium]|nr:SDR family NAD(P)-dependent oxidoreductase [bacterium]